MPVSKSKKQKTAHPSIALEPSTLTVPAPARTPTPPVKIPAATGDPRVTTTETPVTPVAVSSPPSPALPSLVSAPPAPSGMVVPPGFVAPDMRAFRGAYPSKAKLAVLGAALIDLGNFVDSASVLGNTAPAPSTVASAANVAASWRAMRDSTAEWDAYVKAQDGMAWKQATLLFDALKPHFLLAVATNGALASQYPGLAAFFNAADVVARQALTTRKKNAKAAAVAAAEASASALATAKAQAASATPVKAGVTVNA